MSHAVPSLFADPALRLVTAADLEPAQATGSGPLSQLARGQTHEWFLVSGGEVDRRARAKVNGGGWNAPLTILANIGAQVATAELSRLVWIGRRCWPSLQVLCAANGALAPSEALRRSLFLDPLTDAERFWAIGQALRVSAEAGIAAVIADGSGMDGTVSRRLQLAAEGGKGLALLARPPDEMGEGGKQSWAATKWRVSPVANAAAGGGSASNTVAWRIELRSCRGQHREQDAPHTWLAAWSYQVFRGTGTLDFSAELGCGVAAAPQGDRRRDSARGAGGQTA